TVRVGRHQGVKMHLGMARQQSEKVLVGAGDVRETEEVDMGWCRAIVLCEDLAQLCRGEVTLLPALADLGQQPTLAAELQPKRPLPALRGREETVRHA